MSEPPIHTTRDIPKLRGVKVANITAMVRIPGRPAALRAYTADQADVGRKYAEQAGGECVPLPVQDPAWDWSRPKPARP